MIKLCPFCGHSISRPLINGITTCDHCSQVFESSIRNQTLSAAWIVRRWYIQDVHTLREKFGYSEEVLEVIDKYVISLGMSHDELLEVIGPEIPLDQSA